MKRVQLIFLIAGIVGIIWYLLGMFNWEKVYLVDIVTAIILLIIVIAFNISLALFIKKRKL